jgi:hypothetical protein
LWLTVVKTITIGASEGNIIATIIATQTERKTKAGEGAAAMPGMPAVSPILRVWKTVTAHPMAANTSSTTHTTIRASDDGLEDAPAPRPRPTGKR